MFFFLHFYNFFYPVYVPPVKVRVTLDIPSQVRRQRRSNWTPLKKHEDNAIKEAHACLWTKMKIHQLSLSNTKHEDAIEEVRKTQCLPLVFPISLQMYEFVSVMVES